MRSRGTRTRGLLRDGRRSNQLNLRSRFEKPLSFDYCVFLWPPVLSSNFLKVP